MFNLDNSAASDDGRRRFYRRAALVLALLVLLVLLLLMLRFCMPHSASIGSYELDGDAQRHVAGAKPGSFGESIEIPGFDQIPLRAGSKTCRIQLYNPENNPCYFRFSIVLDAGGEVLYESGLVSPGFSVDEQELKHGLAAGEYAAHIAVSTYSLEDKSPMNGANVATRIVVS
jgi:hypothetical protein